MAEKNRICLNMIVKDEGQVIERCLSSIKSIIDYWVIVDTGSTDGTQEIISTYLKGVPGELYERPWKNFGHNRSEAFDLARNKGDYILFMDADDILAFDDPTIFDTLIQDAYTMWRGSDQFSYLKVQLAKGNLPWKWVGVTHEYLHCDVPYSTGMLESVRYMTLSDGASSYDPAKFHKNIALLEEGLKEDPTNSRYAFYLAESYRDAKEKGKAIEWYQKRIEMGGWAEEVFWSMLQVAHLTHEIKIPSSIVIELYKRAHQYRLHRSEPLYFIADIYNKQGDYEKAYACLKSREFLKESFPEEKDILFNMDWIENYGLLFQLSICSYFVGNYVESMTSCDQLLKIKGLPPEWQQLVIKNRTYPAQKLMAYSNE